MTQFRRRSWRSAPARRNEGLRLSTMIVLFVVVLLLIVAANRPEIWSHFLPNLVPPAPAHPAATDAKAAVPPQETAPAPRIADRQSPFLLGGLIVVAIIYFGWRIARIGRAVARRAQVKRTDVPRPPPPINHQR